MLDLIQEILLNAMFKQNFDILDIILEVVKVKVKVKVANIFLNIFSTVSTDLT